MMHAPRHAPSPRRRSARPPLSHRPHLTNNAAHCEPLEPRLLLAADPLLAPFPQSILAHHGRSDAAVVGDIDQDGWSDILVGNVANFASGRSWVSTFGAFLLSGRDGSVLREHEVGSSGGTDTSGSFGQAVAGIGDVTGDGVPDYAIGRPNEGHGFVHVYSGATGEELAALTHDVFASNGLGSAILGLGDVTGDDVPDFAVGVPRWDYRPPGTTSVYIYSGADFSLHAAAGAYAFFIGGTLGLAGDVNNDGAADFITGGDRVYSGATADLLLQLDIAGAGVIDPPAASVSIADLDGDGRRDFATLFVQSQRLVAFSGADGSFMRTIATFDSLPGRDLAVIGDRTGGEGGDGFDEVAVSINGVIEVRSTSDGALLQTIADPDMAASTPGGHSGHGGLGTHLAAGDINGDGRLDLVSITPMLGSFGVTTGPGRTDLFLGQDMGVDLFDPAALARRSDLRITSDDGLIMAGVNAYGDLIAFTRVSTESPWRFHTLLEGAGVLALDAFDNPRTGRLTIVASTSDGLRLFAFVPTGEWVESAIDDDAGRITHLMEAFEFADGRIGIVGTGIDDALYLYEQSGNDWAFTNITLDLSTDGQVHPRFGEFTVYVAPWNAVHITGRDRSEGGAIIETVWRSHLTDGWVTTRTGAEVPEAQALSNLSAFVTPWGGLHVAGVTPEGHVGVLWWSFELLETGWEYTDLTAAVNGPLFQQVPITTYVTDWGGLNIAGVNQDGDLSAYWWVPGESWVSETVAIDPGSMPLLQPVAILDSVFEPRHDGMRITAVGEDGDIFLYTWRPANGSTWLFENLTQAVA